MKRVNFDPSLQSKQDEAVAFLEGEKNEQAVAGSEETSAETLTDEAIIEKIVVALKDIYDPEIPVNIYDLGLIYRVSVEKGYAEVDMTLTTPGCPVAQTFPGQVEHAVKQVMGVTDAVVDLVWEPPWTQDKLTDEARLHLGLM